MTTTTRSLPTVSADIRTRRRNLGLTQADIAVAAKCSVQSVAYFERGWLPARSEKLTQVLRTLERLEQNPA